MTTLTVLEDKIASDFDGRYFREILSQLDESAKQLASQMRQPTSADDYKALERKYNACISSMRVVDAVWKRHHSSSKT